MKKNCIINNNFTKINTFFFIMSGCKKLMNIFVTRIWRDSSTAYGVNQALISQYSPLNACSIMQIIEPLNLLIALIKHEEIYKIRI